MWRMRNTGTCTWGSYYTLSFSSGTQLASRSQVSVTGVKPGASVDISVDMTAPIAAGTYRSTWRMNNAAGQFFGESTWAEIRVGGGPTQPPVQPTSTPAPASGIELCDGTGFGPPCQVFTEGKHNLADRNWQDRAESVRFRGGYAGNYHVVLYSEANQIGNPYHADGDVPDLGESHRNRVRSVEIYRRHEPTPTPASSAEGIELCDGRDYGGPCQTYMHSGNDACLELGALNDRAESLRFRGGYVGNYEVILHGDSSCNVYLARLGQDAPAFEPGLRNQFSSIRIERRGPPPPPVSADGVELCDRQDYGGPCQTYRYSSNDVCIALEGQDRRAESLRFRGDYIGYHQAIMYGDPGCGRYLARFGEDISAFEPGLRNQFSSMRIERHRPGLQSPPNGAVLDEGQAIALSWSAVADEYSGEIWGGPNGTLGFGWQGGTAITIGAQPPGHTYSWHVKTRNSAGESSWSDTGTFSVRQSAVSTPSPTLPSPTPVVATPTPVQTPSPTQTPPPPMATPTPIAPTLIAPSNLTAGSAPGNKIVLNWQDNSTNEDGFKIYRDGRYVGQVASNTVVFGETGTQRRAYSYHVTAFNAAGESSPSNTASVTLPGQLAPPVPLTPKEGAYLHGGQPIAFSWTATGVEYYGEINVPSWGVERQYGGQITFGWQQGTSTTITLPDPPTARLAQWHVRARNVDGTSQWSSTVNFTLWPSGDPLPNAVVMPDTALSAVEAASSAAAVPVGVLPDMRSVRGPTILAAVASWPAPNMVASTMPIAVARAAPAITIAPTSGPPGTRFVVAGTGFAAGDRVSIIVVDEARQATVITSVRVGADGVISESIDSSGYAPGQYGVVIAYNETDVLAKGVFFVTSTGLTPPGGSGQCFPETGKCVQGTFLTYWHAHGNLAINGYPISDERAEILEDGKSYRVQYFERVRMEYHLENAPPNDVLLGQFGRALRPADPPVPAIPGATYFEATGHNVTRQAFVDYWTMHGGLPQFGFPISEEFTETLEDGKPYTVQYFERARFEWHPENAPPYDVLLGQFGRRILEGR